MYEGVQNEQLNLTNTNTYVSQKMHCVIIRKSLSSYCMRRITSKHVAYSPYFSDQSLNKYKYDIHW